LNAAVTIGDAAPTPGVLVVERVTEGR